MVNDFFKKLPIPGSPIKTLRHPDQDSCGFGNHGIQYNPHNPSGITFNTIWSTTNGEGVSSEDTKAVLLSSLEETYIAFESTINESKGFSLQPEGTTLLATVAEAKAWLSDYQSKIKKRLEAWSGDEVRDNARLIRIRTRNPRDQLRTLRNTDLPRLVNNPDLNRPDKNGELYVDKLRNTLIETQGAFQNIVKEFLPADSTYATTSSSHSSNTVSKTV